MSWSLAFFFPIVLVIIWIILPEGREDDEALALLIDLFEIEAEHVEQWTYTKYTLNCKLQMPGLSLTWDLFGGPDYHVNGIRLSSRGDRVAAKLVQTHTKWRKEQDTLEVLVHATAALKKGPTK